MFRERIFQEKTRSRKNVDNEDYTILLTDDVIVVASETSAVAITLPPVAKAKGYAFSIYAPDGNTQTVTVTSAGDDFDAAAIGLDAADDRAIWLSDGYAWTVITPNGVSY